MARRLSNLGRQEVGGLPRAMLWPRWIEASLTDHVERSEVKHMTRCKGVEPV